MRKDWASSFVLPPFVLDSTYKLYHMIFVFFCLTYFTQYEFIYKMEIESQI